MYRCEASCVEGFIQQLAVSYVGNGYWFYVAGSVPEGKDPERIDAKLIEKYGIGVSKWTRARRKKLGFGSLQYIRFGRFFILIATQGNHDFFLNESQIRDVRRCPIRFAGYSISYRKGRDGSWHASVRIDAAEFRLIKRHFLKMALTKPINALIEEFHRLAFAPYAPVRNQYRELLRAVNKRRNLAGFEAMSYDVIPIHRKVVMPFKGGA